jgi:hypothetical protein
MWNAAKLRAELETAEPVLVLPDALADLRFRNLLGKAGWAQLPEAVRHRFGKRLNAGDSATYAGHVLHCRMHLCGWLLAQACRMIGAPLPLDRGGGAAAVVSVTEHGPSGGQTWTRIYARKRGFPQVIHSAKQFAGPTGLEEYLGGGFGIALCVSPIEGGIRFSSDHYFLQLGRLRLRIPKLLAPGLLTIDHADCGSGTFTFTLALHHVLLGEVFFQQIYFHDQANKLGGINHD